ncbi:ABC transporter permease [Sulfurimonas sp.]|uniref:ABC transporter permease n=1 Tax=Sulfurimonas sp. TaxID=2022749 RepID=UPI003D0E75E2
MYKIIFKLAFKNAFLRLSRTILVIMMIAVSMSMMVSIEGLYDGVILSMADKTKRSDCGEISLYSKDYRTSKALSDTIKNAITLQKELQKNPDIQASVLRLKADGLSATARKSAFSTIIGINLLQEEHFGEFSKFLKEGKLTLDKRGVLIGSELAKTLKAKLGSKIIFSTQDATGEINDMLLRVRGIVQTNNIALDGTALFVNKEKLHNFLMIPSSQTTQIAIRSDVVTLQKQLQEDYPTLDVKSFLELYPMIPQMQDMMVIFNTMTFFIVMSVVFIGIMGVMYVSILDRIREFGIMRSIGMSYKLIRFQIFLEALFVGVIGYILGAILGYFALVYLQTYGLDLSEFADGLASFGQSSTVFATIKSNYFTSTFAAIVIASLLSVLLPLRKIKHMNTIEVTKVDI